MPWVNKDQNYFMPLVWPSMASLWEILLGSILLTNITAYRYLRTSGK